MSEWFKELVLKTSDSKEPRVRISVSPPKERQASRLRDLPSLKDKYEYKFGLEKYSSWPKRRPC